MLVSVCVSALVLLSMLTLAIAIKAGIDSLPAGVKMVLNSC
jgi:hypothetical protein